MILVHRDSTGRLRSLRWTPKKKAQALLFVLLLAPLTVQAEPVRRIHRSPGLVDLSNTTTSTEPKVVHDVAVERAAVVRTQERPSLRPAPSPGIPPAAWWLVGIGAVLAGAGFLVEERRARRRRLILPPHPVPAAVDLEDVNQSTTRAAAEAREVAVRMRRAECRWDEDRREFVDEHGQRIPTMEEWKARHERVTLREVTVQDLFDQNRRKAVRWVRDPTGTTPLAHRTAERALDLAAAREALEHAGYVVSKRGTGGRFQRKAEAS